MIHILSSFQVSNEACFINTTWSGERELRHVFDIPYDISIEERVLDLPLSAVVKARYQSAQNSFFRYYNGQFLSLRKAYDSFASLIIMIMS